MKKIFILILTLVVLPFTVSAISEEGFDPDAKIGLPFMITSNGATITVYDTTDYELYYQWIEMSIEKYQELESINNIKDGIADEINALEKPKRDDYESIDLYNEAVTSYNAKYDEIKARYDEMQKKYLEAFPEKDETKWKNAVEDKVYLPETNYSGTKPYFMYVKLVDNENNDVAYEATYLEIEGSEEQVDVPSDDESDETSSEDETIDNPSTGLFTNISLLLLISVFGLIIYLVIRKKNKFKNF